jgi:elongation factor Ts
MTTVSMIAVKQLRDETGAPYGQCKSALMESGGDLSLATDWLRKSGALVGAKKTHRLAADGAVAADSHKGFGAVLEISSETDFVARSEPFKNFIGSVLNVAMTRTEGAIEKLLTHPLNGEMGEISSIAESTLELAGRIGENIVLRRLVALKVNPGVVVSYIHQSFPESPKIGKLGVLVALESSAEEGALRDLGKNLAMHIAFAKPQCVSIGQVQASVLEKETIFLQNQIQEQSGDRSEDVQKKMVEGRLRKFFEGIVLEEQDYARDSGKKIKDILIEEGKRLGSHIRITDFAYIKLSEAL